MVENTDQERIKILSVQNKLLKKKIKDLNQKINDLNQIYGLLASNYNEGVYLIEHYKSLYSNLLQTFKEISEQDNHLQKRKKPHHIGFLETTKNKMVKRNKEKKSRIIIITAFFF